VHTRFTCRIIFLVETSTISLMGTSVKMSGEAKRILDFLQVRLLTTGKKISQQDLLDTLVRFSAEWEDELVSFIIGI